MRQIFTLLFVVLITTLTTHAQVPNYVPSNGLLGWWPFNGNANDESGNANNGTVNGAILTTDRFGVANKAYSFDGVNDCIEIIDNSLMELGNSYSVGAWVKMDSTPNESYTIISKERQLDATGYAMIFSSNNTITHAFLNNSNFSTSGSKSVSLNTWHFIVHTYNGTTITNYIDGIIDTSRNFTQTHMNSNLNWFFGKEFTTPGGGSSGYTNRYLNGCLDDIGIWNRALTTQEISDLYNANICYQTVTVTDTLVINTNITSYNPITYMNTIKVYPNPTNDHITIDYGNYTTLNGYTVKIINSLSQVVFNASIVQQSSYIDLSTWNGNGVYFVQLIDSTGNIVDIRKIVLQ